MKVNNLFIKNEYLEILLKIFETYCKKATIWAYGSRVKNEAHNGSDLDLTVIDWGETGKNVRKLRELLIESNIPFLVDINEYKSLPKSFQNEISKEYIKIWNKQ